MDRSFSVPSDARVALRFLLILLLFVASACAHGNTEWHGARWAPGYVVPARIPLVVDVSQRAREADQANTIDTMALAVLARLVEHGVESTIVSPKPSHLPSPRVEIIVRAFDEGDAAESYLSGLVVGGPVAGESQLVVVCRAYSPSNQLMFEGTVKGANLGTSDPRDLAETTGTAIAEGLIDPESTRPVYYGH